MNKQFEMIFLYMNTIVSDSYAETDEYTSMSMTTIYKNLISIYSTLDLIRQGLYGSSRVCGLSIFS